MNLDNHILQNLATVPDGKRAITIGDLAREFGVSTGLVLSAARRLVERGAAKPVMVDVHGVPTLRALRPARAAEPVASVADPVEPVADPV